MSVQGRKGQALKFLYGLAPSSRWAKEAEGMNNTALSLNHLSVNFVSLHLILYY